MNTEATPQPPAENTSGETLRARQASLALLEDVLNRKHPLDQALERSPALPSLPGRDRAFVRMLTATVLRRLGQIDHIIIKAMEGRPLSGPPSLHHVLRMGAAQILFMNVPDYAVVDTSVRLAEKQNMGRQKGLVNAVLRRIAKDGPDWLAKQDAARLNTPDWLMKLWIADYGLRTAAEIAQANLSEAPLDITVKDPTMLEYWAGTLDAAILPTGTLCRASGGNIQELPGYDDGMWWVQDFAASLPVKLLGNVSGKTVIDLCAAPGGKTAQLAALGANVVALDRSAGRLKRLNENLQRLRLEKNVTTIAADAAVWTSSDPVHTILLDAPCSATGTVRRHPDVLHLKTPGDLERLVEAQKRILSHAISLLPPGGVLIYCTCSLQKAEGEDQIEALIASGAPVKRVPVTADELGGMDGLLTEMGDVRILPFHMAAHGGMDGFYISRLQKQ